MTYETGAIPAIQALFGPLVPLFALVTQLGDVWFLLVLLSTLYLADGHVSVVRGRLDRRAVAFVVALAIGGLALTSGLKLFVAMPRPPGAGTPVNGGWLPGPLYRLYVGAVAADGYGFSSGHALGSTVVYGGLALVYGQSRSRRPLLAAAGLAGLIGFSRIVIGVHHVVSVLGGFAFGIGYLLIAMTLTDDGRNVETAFLLAVVAAVVAVVIGGYERDPMIALGMALGGWLTWHFVGERITAVTTPSRERWPLVGVGLVVVGVLFAGMELLDLPLPLTALVSALIVAVLLVLPVAAAERKSRA